MDDNTAVIPAVEREPVVYGTPGRSFHRTVNRVRGTVARWIAGDGLVRRFMRLLLANMAEDFQSKTAGLERATLRLVSEAGRLRQARQYSKRAKHKRRVFVSCSVLWKLERERFVDADTPDDERTYPILTQTRFWQESHNAGSAAR